MSELRLTQFKVLLFDVYATLVVSQRMMPVHTQQQLTTTLCLQDWETGIYEALKPMLHRVGSPLANSKKDALLAFESVELDLQHKHPTLLYSDILAHAHAELARRRVYVHPIRWTSLGLSLLEAMHLGMPVVGLATTEAVEAVPAEAGVLSTNPERLWAAVREFVHDEDAARLAGKAARAAALERYGLPRFLSDWDQLLGEVTR